MLDGPLLGVLTALAAVVVYSGCVLRGARQRREAGASVGRLLGVAAVLTALVLLPLALAHVLGVDDWILAALLQRGGHAHGGGRLDFVVLVVATVLCGKVAFSALRPVGRLFARGEDLPPLEDRAVLARIEELAHRIGAPVPRVLVRGSVGPRLQALAAAGGIVAPTLVVSDGVLHRLRPDERDAILAHELAHVARRTVWTYVLLMSASQVLAAAASAVTAPLVALVLCLFLVWAVLKVAGHFEEPACDLRAARAVGFATLASALDKIHAGHLIEQEGRLAAWIHATQTHPSKAVRLSILHAAAPPGERAAIGFDPGTVRAHRRASRLALLAAVAAVAWAVWAGNRPGLVGSGAALLAAAALLPPALLLAPHLRDLVQLWRLRVVRLPRYLLAQLLGIAVALGAIVSMFAVAELGIPPVWTLLVAVAVLALSIRLGGRARRAAARVHLAFGKHDFGEALRLLDGLPARAARRPENRLYRAIALAVGGDRAAAEAELEAAIAVAPRYHPARLLLATLVAPDDPERSLRLADEVEAAVPGTHHVLAHRAAALRRLGRHQEADALMRRALERKPNDGSYVALAARIAVGAGDLERAEELLARAETLQPGDALPALVRAELALARGRRDDARALAATAREASSRQPLAFLERDVAALEARL